MNPLGKKENRNYLRCAQKLMSEYGMFINWRLSQSQFAAINKVINLCLAWFNWNPQFLIKAPHLLCCAIRKRFFVRCSTYEVLMDFLTNAFNMEINECSNVCDLRSDRENILEMQVRFKGNTFRKRLFGRRWNGSIWQLRMTVGLEASWKWEK